MIKGMQFFAFVLCCYCTLGVLSITDYYKAQIDRSKADVNRILEYIHRGAGKYQTYDRLAELGDRFGHRSSGSESLERAIDYIVQHMRNISLENVTKEDVMVPKWERGFEYGNITVPAYGWTRNMEIMALGRSPGTNGIINAQGILVNSEEELNAMSNAEVAGKIVIFNAPRQWVRYDPTYRSYGAVYAERKGAIAALVRSVTGKSIYSPHTGTSLGAPIPFAAIALEDAELLQRIRDRGLTFNITLYMEAQNYADSTSYNAIGDIRGTDSPNEMVLIGGHIDTWDVTDGSMDDGGGVMMASEAIAVLKALGLRPKKTIRLIMWTAEEYGVVGSIEYYRRHNTTDRNTMSLIMQADQGSFSPFGINFTGSALAREIMQYIMSEMLVENNTTQVCEGSGASSDSGVWVDNGVPGVELCNANQNYFDFHHSRGDSMEVLDRNDMDRNTAIWAVVSYVVANMDDILPRTGDASLTTTDDAPLTTTALHATTLHATVLQAISLQFLLLSILLSFFLMFRN